MRAWLEFVESQWECLLEGFGWLFLMSTLRCLISRGKKEEWRKKNLSVAKSVFSFMWYFSFNLELIELHDFFVMHFFYHLKTYLIDYLLRFTKFIDIFDTVLIITLFLIASHPVCLLTFSFITIINGFFEILIQIQILIQISWWKFFICNMI